MNVSGQRLGGDPFENDGAVVCAHCGSAVPAATGHCPSCRRPLPAVDALTVAQTRLGNDADPPTQAPIEPETQAGTTSRPDDGADGRGWIDEHNAADAQTIAPGAQAGSAASGDTGPLEVGQSFGPRYHIIRLLGVGGMGAVYQAWDAELGVAVAIKVIRPQIMADVHAAAQVERRFKRELLLARQVTHRNVVRIHDLGMIAGVKYITMSFVDGVDLATKLKREGRQPVRGVMGLARGVAGGLVAAHAAGVVHRDLKPANIMIQGGGEALIMDFGIALSTGDGAKSPPSHESVPEALRGGAAPFGVTTAGGIVGTVEYMAPEQAKGLAVDQRADVYAFGLILYDALIGRRRHEHAASAVDDLQRRMVSPPTPVKALAPDIPDALNAVIARCLEPDPEKRYQTSAELAGDLDRLDDDGKLIPVARRLTPRLMAVAALLTIALLAGTFFLTRQAVQPAQVHDPVSVIIADLDNDTGDQAFNGTLEPMLKLALEEAGFISAFDRTQIRPRLGLQPPDPFDEPAARTIALNQGVGVVLAGAVAPQGRGFSVNLRAFEAVTGNVLAEVGDRAPNRDQVLRVVTELATEIRETLGDDTSDSSRRFATETLSTTSLTVVRDYAAAMEALADSRFEDALKGFEKALEGDPTFGLAYVGMASSSRNLSRAEDAERYAKEAVRYLGRMTERERYRARGVVYLATNDYPQCLKEFQAMLARYAADVVAYNNLANCQTQLRDLSGAVATIRRAAELLPKRSLYRLNLALFTAYVSEFATAETEARATQELGNSLGMQPLAYAYFGQGRLNEAADAYRALANVAPPGPAIAALGLGDLAIYEGRFSDAVRILGEGAAADLQNKSASRAADKLIRIAQAELLRDRNDAAIASAKKALEITKAVTVRFAAARVLAQAGDLDAARAISEGLASEIQPEPRAYARIVDANIHLYTGNAVEAMKVFEEANALRDTWVGQFDLGRAYLAAGLHTQADSAFERCLKRRGELFLDEEPGYGYLPSVYYYQGRAREEQQVVGFEDAYRTYLNVRQAAGEDPLLPDVRKRAGL